MFRSLEQHTFRAWFCPFNLRNNTARSKLSKAGPDACAKPFRIQCFLTDWGHHYKDRQIDIRVRKTNLLIIRCMFFWVSIGRKPNTWPAINCLRIMACSWVVPSKSVRLKIMLMRNCRITLSTEKWHITSMNVEESNLNMNRKLVIEWQNSLLSSNNCLLWYQAAQRNYNMIDHTRLRHVTCEARTRLVLYARARVTTSFLSLTVQ